MIIGYCYGGDDQDRYGAQLKISYNGIQFRTLDNSIWSDWKTIL